MSEITASVVLYNTPESQLMRLIECIEKSSISADTYMVDNSPHPADLSCFHLPGIKYIRADANKGYGAGHNIALRRIIDHSKYHFVLNPDVYFGPEELEKMIGFMDANPAIGHLMPKVVYPDGSLQYLCKLLPTPADLFVRRFAYGPMERIAYALGERFELRHSGYDKVMDVPFLSGCFMLLRTTALHSVGLFDERFFMYGEDIDLSRRMHAQYRTVFYPSATIVHDHARESYKSKRALWIHITNLVKYFNKWGWLRDPERSRINREIQCQISQIKSHLRKTEP
jgi:GT2 family glycosyltransferase